MSNSSSEGSPVNPSTIYYSRIQRRDESLFLVLQVVGGQVLLPLLVLTTAFSRKVHRSPVFINFCFSWIISSVVYSLLVYRGRSDPEDLSLNPSSQECLVQASLINGAQALTSCATLGIVIQLFMILRDVKNGMDVEKGRSADYRHVLTYVLLVVPMVVFATISIVSAVLGSPIADDLQGVEIPNSNLALPGTFYCLILLNGTSIVGGLSLVRAAYIFAAVVSLTSFCLEVAIAIVLLRRRSFFRALLPSGWVSLLVRVVAFSLYRLLALGLNLAVIAHPDELFLTGISQDNLYNGVIDFIQAAIPLVAFFTFASERDVLSAWSSTKSWTWQPWQDKSNPRSKVARKNSEDSNTLKSAL